METSCDVNDKVKRSWVDEMGPDLVSMAMRVPMVQERTDRVGPQRTLSFSDVYVVTESFQTSLMDLCQ